MNFREQCIRKYNDCVNNKDNEIPDDSFSRQIINILLSHAGLKVTTNSKLYLFINWLLCTALIYIYYIFIKYSMQI